MQGRERDLAGARLRGHSSVGRAPDLHSGGRRFDSVWLHHHLCHERKKFIRFRSICFRDICHRKGKIDPAGRRPSWVCVTSFSRITGRAAMCGIGKGSVCKKPTCLIETQVCGAQMRFPLHMSFKNDQASKGHPGDVLAVRGDERRGTLR